MMMILRQQLFLLEKKLLTGRQAAKVSPCAKTTANAHSICVYNLFMS